MELSWTLEEWVSDEKTVGQLWEESVLLVLMQSRLWVSHLGMSEHICCYPSSPNAFSLHVIPVIYECVNTSMPTHWKIEVLVLIRPCAFHQAFFPLLRNTFSSSPHFLYYQPQIPVWLSLPCANRLHPIHTTVCSSSPHSAYSCEALLPIYPNRNQSSGNSLNSKTKHSLEYLSPHILNSLI